MKTKEEEEREGYHIFRDKQTIEEDMRKETERLEKIADQTNIRNYCKQFQEHRVLSGFPFQSFNDEQKLRFIEKIKAVGTGTILSSAAVLEISF